MTETGTAHAVYSPDDGGWYVEVYGEDGDRWTTSIRSTKRQAKEEALDKSPCPYMTWTKSINLND